MHHLQCQQLLQGQHNLKCTVSIHVCTKSNIIYTLLLLYPIVVVVAFAISQYWLMQLPMVVLVAVVSNGCIGCLSCQQVYWLQHDCMRMVAIVAKGCTGCQYSCQWLYWWLQLDIVVLFASSCSQLQYLPMVASTVALVAAVIQLYWLPFIIVAVASG